MTKLGMLRSGKKSKTLVVVEGVTDYKVYGKLLNPKCCELIIGESKDNVIEAVTLCEEAHLEGIIGIIDADFWHVQSDSTYLSKQLFVTDAHDLECMMLRSKAFDYVFIEYGDEGKRAKFERQVQEKLIYWMLKNVALVGCLRKISLERGLELRFSQLDFQQFIDMNRLEVQVDRMIQEILFHSRKHNVYTTKQLRLWLEEEIKRRGYPIEVMQQNGQKNQMTESKRKKTSNDELEIEKDKIIDDLWQICCGHDLMEWLMLGFVNKFGQYNSNSLSSGQLEGSFRLTYHTEMFTETNIYKNLQLWESAQKQYGLFTSNKTL